jgi:formate dehydrogenase major subunit
MIHLTIDGRPVAVDAGSTVLTAAEWLGIHIPVMCHVKGIEPAASCFVCAVQIEGHRTLSPACAMPVAEGMVVHTATEDVRKARKVALELLLSDHAGECEAPCAVRCPANLDIPGFTRHIASGDPGRAMEVIAGRLALSGSLGRVCPRLCEQQCRRGELDQGLAIGALHRYVADVDLDSATPYTPVCNPRSGKRVAIIGAGPAGLAAAYYLRRHGHDCTVLDAHEQPGGMLRYGIPEYRLPKRALDAEIDAVLQLGAVELRMGTKWGRDFDLGGLRATHEAVFIAIGAQGAQGLRCIGEELAVPGIGFLELVAGGHSPAIGNDVVIVGGGNTAMDCARTARRLGARTRVLYRRTRQEMPCLMQEVEAAEAEGVQIDYLVAPVSVARDSAAGFRLLCRRMTLGEPDSSGRRSPMPLEGSEFWLECSAVIAATGQSVDRELAKREGLDVSAWGIAADPHTMATNIPGVFAGGDAVLGADLAVRAVAAGRMAAASIHQFLGGESITGEPQRAAVEMHPLDDAERAAIFRAIEKAPRTKLPEIGLDRRLTSFDEVEGRLPDAGAAMHEARRCMSCGCRKCDCCTIRSLATEYGADVNRFVGARRRFSQDTSHPEIVFEPGKCINCDACVKIAAAAGEKIGMAMRGRGFDVKVGPSFGKPLSEALTVSALRYAEACPTGALALRAQRACEWR